MEAEAGFASLDLQAVAFAGLVASYRHDGVSAWLTSNGTSMVPLIPPGSRILVEFGAKPDVGDVVLVMSRGRYLAHRVVGRRSAPDGRQLIVKGDAEAWPDPAVDPADVLGVVRAVRRTADGSLLRRGLGGISGRVIARTSISCARAARIGRRLVLKAPVSARPVAMRAIAGAARVPTRLISAPLQIIGAERR